MIVLFDNDYNSLLVQSVTNPGGSSPINQGPENLFLYQTLGYNPPMGASIDDIKNSVNAAMYRLSTNTSKWFDSNFAANGMSSRLRITLATPASIAAYTLVTANDVPRRDPVSWTLKIIEDANTQHTIDVRTNYLPSTVWRNYMLGFFFLVSPPSPPAPVTAAGATASPPPAPSMPPSPMPPPPPPYPPGLALPPPVTTPARAPSRSCWL